MSDGNITVTTIGRVPNPGDGVDARAYSGRGSVTVITAGPPTAEPLALRIRRLQTEARTLAREHVEMLRASLHDTARLAAEIADGGEAYPVGAREMARRLTEEAAAQALTLGAINERGAG